MKKLISCILATLCILSSSICSFAANAEDAVDNTIEKQTEYIYTDMDYQNLLEKEKQAEEMYQQMSVASISPAVSPYGIMPSTKEYLIPVRDLEANIGTKVHLYINLCCSLIETEQTKY